MKSLLAAILLIANLSLDDIILDIYNAATEVEDVDFEQLQSDLYALHEYPIDLNSATEADLAQLPFLTPRQIDDILLYVYRHPLDSLYELRLIPSLTDYEIRDLLPFVTLSAASSVTYNKLQAKEVFRGAKHELILRTDARNIEAYEGTDPVYLHTRYRFDYRRRVMFGLQLRRPAGGDARTLQYGGWLQLNDIGPFHTIVAGNFQASFGHGLVLAPVRHFGKIAYVNGVGLDRQGLRYYSSVDGAGLHGAGATYRHSFNAHTRLDVSALYSLRRANDSTRHHLLGANLTLRHRRLQVELTAIENLWSDSVHPYQNAAYNAHYFRGHRQAVLGASARYHYGWGDAFAEVAVTQPSEVADARWGYGLLAGSRFYPTDGLTLTLLARHYSPWFDNALAYAFSETSRLGNESGGYLGFLLSRLRHWQLRGYADMFYFAGRKYGIRYAPSWGYDALLETTYSDSRGGLPYSLSLRARARRKGSLSTYSARLQGFVGGSGWSSRTTLEANLTSDSLATRQYGVTVYEDLMFDFSSLPLARPAPLSLRLRLQLFDARQWDNRIYCYENDVLYAFSIPAVYGIGGRAYLCLRWQVIPQLALYLRVSETLYTRRWAIDHDRPLSRTDIHLLLRAKF